MRNRIVLPLIVFMLLAPIALCQALTQAPATPAQNDWAVVIPAQYVAPTATATPASHPDSGLPPLTLGAPNVCYTSACNDYGNGATTTGASKSKKTYPYLLIEQRVSKSGVPYTYTRWVMAPPTKAQVAP